MPQQYTDRAYETCTVVGTADVTLTGPILGYQILPTGESVCVIEGMAAGFLNGEWEVVRGVRTGSIFTRDTVVDSSNNGNKVNFTDDAEIALVFDSESIDELFLVAYTANSTANDAFAKAANNESNIASNLLLIQSNDIDINILQGQIYDNDADIAQNVSDIAQNATDIANLSIGVTPNAVSKVDTALQTMIGELELPDATLSAIDILVNANTVVDVFLYIPSIHDDDNGAWIESANWQSWYNEDLNSSNRGATRAFPELALIVVEAKTITIYDASDSTLPMWLYVTRLISNILSFTINNDAISSITMKNGVLYIGGYDSISTFSALGVINFITDSMWVTGAAWTRYFNEPVSGRSDALTYIQESSPAIASRLVNDVAVISDGNGNNIVYVGTDGGLSRIAADGTVSNWTDEGNTVNIVRNISIFDTMIYWSTNSSAPQLSVITQNATIPLEDHRFFDLDFRHFSGEVAISYDTLGRVVYHYGNINSFAQAIVKNTIGTDHSLTKLYPNPNDWGRSMIANITADFNSGIMHGDIRGAWLADTDISNLTDTNLVTDGIFNSACGVNWTCGADWSISGGEAVMALTSTFDPLIQSLTGLTIGKNYILEFDVIAITDTCKVNLTGTDEGELQFNTPGAQTHHFIATSTVVSLNFARQTQPSSMTIDNVLVRIEEADRSYKNNSLSVFGTIIRNPVAPNAELAAYSNFSVSDYLEQPYNADLDFGTGDLHIMCWVIAPAPSYRPIFDRDSLTPSPTTNMLVDMGLDNAPRMTIGGIPANSGIIAPQGELASIVFYRKDGVLYSRINNVEGASVVNTRNIVDLTAITRIGTRVDLTTNFAGGGIMLLKIGAGAPTNEQFNTMYEEEKRILQPDSKCTLQGTSSDVKAVDFDEVSNVVTACAGDTITKFRGLLAIESRTETATSVSTVNNKEATGA